METIRRATMYVAAAVSRITVAFDDYCRRGEAVRILYGRDLENLEARIAGRCGRDITTLLLRFDRDLRRVFLILGYDLAIRGLAFVLFCSILATLDEGHS